MSAVAGDRIRLRQFAYLCAVEPDLSQLLIDAMREQPTTDRFIDGYKTRLQNLVGYGARHPQLRTSLSYDIVYDTIYGLVVDP
jgi:hypothetical protein